VPDSMAGLLLDDMRPALRQNQYGLGLLMAAERLGSTIAQSKGVTIPPPAMASRVRRTTRDSIPWPLILFGIFFLLMLLRGGGGNRHGGGAGAVLDRNAVGHVAELGPRRLRRGWRDGRGLRRLRFRRRFWGIRRGRFGRRRRVQRLVG